jgi:hypothetical protein
MKKLTIFTIIYIISQITYAQVTKAIFDNIVTNNNTLIQSSQKSINDDYEITVRPINKYISGKEMDLEFEIYNSSTTYNFGKYLELQFSQGLTVIRGSDPLSFISFAAYGQHSAYLNDITENNIISWGEKDINFGGIQPGYTKFYVTVDVSSTVADSILAIYYIKSSYYTGADEREFTDTVTIYLIPDVPDLKPLVSGFYSEYNTVPFDQVTSTIYATVTNLGDTLSEVTNFTMQTELTSYNKSKPISVPLGTYEYDIVCFKDFVPAGTGIETFYLSAEASNDFDKTNSTDSVIINISKTDLIRDNGDIIGGTGVSASYSGGIIGNIFTINSKDTLNSVISFHTTCVEGECVKSVVYSVNNEGVPDSLIATSLPVYFSTQKREYVTYFEGEGVILEAGKYFIGLVEDKNLMAVGVTSTPFIESTSWAYFSNMWNDLGILGYKYTFYIRPQFGTKVPDFDIVMDTIAVNRYAAIDEELVITGRLKNKSIDIVNSIDIAYSINNNEPVVQSFTDLNFYNEFNFKLSSKIKFDEIKDYHIKIFLLNPNGNNDVNQTNDTIYKTITVVEYIPKKQVVGEEVTGTWCGECVRGHVFMNLLDEYYPDKWIGISVHNNDPMVLPEYDDSINNHISKYPSGLINRIIEKDPKDFKKAFKNQLKQTAPVEISLKNVSYNSESHKLSFDLSAKFLTVINNARFNAVITENNVTGLAQGYAQSNYYAGGDNGPMGGYEDKPNPVPATDMIYNNVARALLGGWSGTPNSIPSHVEGNDNVLYSYTVILNEDWNLEQINIIGMIINGDGTIINATKGDIHTGIAFTEKNNNYNIYPNPFNNTLIIDNLNNTKQIIINNIIGQTVLSVNVTNNTEIINTTDLKNGIYLISIIGKNNNIVTLKIIK